MRRALPLVVVVAVAGCVTPQPPADNDLARPAAPPVAAPPSGAAATPPVWRPSGMAEVELGGSITLPPGTKGDVTVWIVDAPCWEPAARAFGSTKVVLGKFFREVYVPQGTNLWVCGAVGDGSKPMEIYGTADRCPLLGKGSGEVTFPGLKIALAKGGKKVTAPAQR